MDDPIRKNKMNLSELFGVEPATIESILNTALDCQYEKLNRIMDVAIDYFKTQQGAKSWFSTANRGFGGVTPLSLLNSDAGFERVKNCIIKLKYGMTP